MNESFCLNEQKSIGANQVPARDLIRHGKEVHAKVTNTYTSITKESHIMKKTALVVALAVLLTIVFATAAFAHHQPSLYVSWEAGHKGNTGANGNSPHEGYAKNTEKCNVCHAVHRVRIYNGNVENYTGAVGGWQVNGYSHSGCNNCHSVHGAYTFQGALKEKIVKYTGFPSGMTSANGVVASSFNAEHLYNTGYGTISVAIQDEVFLGPTAGIVSAGNQPLFNGLANTINGVAVNGGVDTADAQVSALCTICHANYSSASEQTINLDNERALFTNGYWDFILGQG